MRVKDKLLVDDKIVFDHESWNDGLNVESMLLLLLLIIIIINEDEEDELLAVVDVFPIEILLCVGLSWSNIKK